MPTGTRDPFEILVHEHAGMLRAYLYGFVRDAAAADDLVQETFVVAWRILDRFDHSRPFAPWLRGIASRIAMSWHRRAARRRLVLCDEPTLTALEERAARFDALPGDTWQERTEALESCLQDLPEEDRNVIDLRYARDLACERIAEAVGQGLEWVKKRLQRARARLAMCVEGKMAGTEGGK
ncbi:MAG: sigma-70 family RNA polymerase sigma factor [Planctomycetes bacterium]|nr:sigma-70 family RNA polymerase sigma factor [Planctomycetota bacterium]